MAPAPAPPPAGAGVHRLGCTGGAVLLEELRPLVRQLLRAGLGTPERAFVQLGTACVPLCEQDVRSAEPAAALGQLNAALVGVLEKQGARPLSRGTTGTVRRVMQWAATSLECCTALLDQMDTSHFREGSLAADRAVRDVLGSLCGVLGEVNDTPYHATPLPLLAVFAEVGLFASLAALLAGRDVAELARRGAMFYQALILVREAALLPDLARLMAKPCGLGGVRVSVLGCLAALAEAARVFLLLEEGRPPRPGDSSSSAAREQQRKMARRVQETHTLLAVRRQQGGGGAPAVGRPPRSAGRLLRQGRTRFTRKGVYERTRTCHVELCSACCCPMDGWMDGFPMVAAPHPQECVQRIADD